MAGMDVCAECGVPTAIAEEQVWLNSGVIVQGTNLSWRIIFTESTGLDSLFSTLEETVGEPIDARVVEASGRSTIFYFENLIRPEIRAMMQGKLIGMDVITEAMMAAAQRNGFGKYELVDLRYEGNEDDYIVIRVTEPFSVPLTVGTLAGSVQIVTGDPQTASLRELPGGVYEITTRVSGGPYISGELETRPYYHRDGDIYLERCPTCGVPKGLANLRWDLGRGVILDHRTGTRMISIGSDTWDPLFRELEKEFGPRIPAAIVEAQRLLIKKNPSSLKEAAGEEQLRTELALRGMGNLREMKMSSRGAHLRIDNAAHHLFLIAFGQAYFERSYAAETSVEWEISENGDLRVKVAPR